jgi:hypothetical protein
MVDAPRSSAPIGPTSSSQPLPRWARGPLSVPWRLGTPAYKIWVKTRSMTCIHALPRRGGLLCHHMSYGPGPRLLAEVSSGTATCPSAPDLTSLMRWAPMLPHEPRPQTSPPCWAELRRCHMSHGSGLCLPKRGAPVLSRVPRPRWPVDHRNKERLSYPRHVARLACFQGTLVCSPSVCKICKPLQCSSIVQRCPTWSLLDMATVVIWPDRMALRDEPCSVQQSDKTGRFHAANVVQDIICYS